MNESPATARRRRQRRNAYERSGRSPQIPPPPPVQPRGFPRSEHERVQLENVINLFAGVYANPIGMTREWKTDYLIPVLLHRMVILDDSGDRLDTTDIEFDVMADFVCRNIAAAFEITKQNLPEQAALEEMMREQKKGSFD